MLGLALTLLGLVAIVVCAIQVYKAAVDTSRNAGIWTLLTIGVGIFFQFILPFVFGILLGVYYLMSGVPRERIAIDSFGLLFILEILCLVLSVVGMFMVMKHVSKLKDEVPGAAMPPPPPQFSGRDHQ